MSRPYLRPVDHPSVWSGNDLEPIDSCTIVLTDRHEKALQDALVSAHERGLTIDTIEREHVDMSSIAEELSAIEQEILHGRGIVVMRGFPIDGYSLEDIETMYWMLCCHLGAGTTQSPRDDRVARVEDTWGKDYTQRAYRNSVQLTMHTDLTDIIAMLSIRKAAHGGLSSYVSAGAVHNEILATRPDLLTPLYNGFRYHRLGAESPGEEPVTPHRIPVLSERGGFVSTCYFPDCILLAVDEIGEPLTSVEIEALEYFDELAMRDDLRLAMMLEPGDVVINNNYNVMHTRDEFWNGETLEEKRLLLRLWLKSNYRRPIHDSYTTAALQFVRDYPGMPILDQMD